MQQEADKNEVVGLVGKVQLVAHVSLTLQYEPDGAGM